MKTYVITNKAPSNIKKIIDIKTDDFIIAVDGAVAEVIKQGIKIDVAIGDFDSLENMSLLDNLVTVKLMKSKDETDTHEAVQYGYDYTNNKVIVIGGIQGNRIEHFIANLYLFNQFPNLVIKDENSKLYLLKKGKHEILKNEYISIFPYNKAIINLRGFKYNLDGYKLNAFDPLCISNEKVKSQAQIEVLEGNVVVVESAKK